MRVFVDNRDYWPRLLDKKISRNVSPCPDHTYGDYRITLRSMLWKIL